MPNQHQLIQIATRHQVYMERLKSQYVNDFSGAFDSIAAQGKKVLRGLGVDNLSDVTRASLKGVMRDLNDIQGQLLSQHIDNLMGQLQDTSDYEAKFEARALKTVAAKAQRAAIAPANPVQAWVRARNDPIHATGQLLEPFVKRISDGAIQQLNAATLTAYDQGLTVPQTIAQLFGTPSANFGDGINALSRRQASTVVRTAVQQVSNTARESTWQENDDIVKGVIWVSTLDSRTTIQCQALDGQTFALDDGPRPPIHPNCRSTTAPWMDDSFDFLDEGATRSSAGGYVDQSSTYYDWLQNQSDSFQDDALGATRAQLFRDGGLTPDRFAALQLNRRFEPLTLDEMRKKEPTAFEKAGL